jgi:PAS domain S-box-containing protein
MSLNVDTSLSNQDAHSKHYLWMSVLAPLLVFLALLTAIELAAREQQAEEHRRSQENLAHKANQIRTQLEYELNSTLHLASGLVSYIESKQGHVVEQELEPWLNNLQASAIYMRNIAIAPNNTITMIFPKKGNEAALGLYYPNNREQWPGVQRVIVERRPVLAGPIHLQQGGLGLIYRSPVFLHNNEYWGLISTVLNFDEIYQLIHTQAVELGIKIAVKDSDNNGKILFGDKDVIANDEIKMSVPGRHWEMIATSTTPTSHSWVNGIRLSGWLIALIISWLFNSFLRSHIRENQILHALNASKFRFSQAFNSAPQGIALISHKGDLIDFNNSLCTTLGYSHDDLEKQNFFTLVMTDQRERLINIIEGIYPKPGSNHQYESVLMHRNGQHIQVIISLAPTHAETYESDWIVQIIDISHRVAIEGLLHEEVSYNQNILHALMDGIMIFDANGSIRSANLAAAKLFNCSPDQLKQQHINQFLQAPEMGSIMYHIKSHTNASTFNANINKDFNYDITGIKITGQTFPLDLQLSCIQRKQENLFVARVCNSSDPKQKTQNEQKIITSRQELSTTLSNLLNLLDQLKNNVSSEPNQHTENLLTSAQLEAIKIAKLIDGTQDENKPKENTSSPNTKLSA